MPQPGSRQSVLVVDDEPIVRDVLSRYLSHAGYGVRTAADGEAALVAARDGDPDLVVLDLMLPRLDGVAVFRRLRGSGNRPAVIMLTARGAETDRIVGLEMGADDYIAKPFSPREVVARVRAVLRRGRRWEAPDGTPPKLTFDGLEIDLAARDVRVAGRAVALTPKEFDLLAFMALNARIAFSRDQLLDEVWDIATDCDPSTVTVHIRRLREKIEADPADPQYLRTVWGVGYRFEG
jgi:DNA-binding response OmpR family regulator